MRILITGSAGFIGSALTLKLLERGEHVFGIDNHNDYYSVVLKNARVTRHSSFKNYTHKNLDIVDLPGVLSVFKEFEPQVVVNLAGQAGVRYSLERPFSYIDSNLIGFTNMLEACRSTNIQHFVYASSSSVYGANTKVPFDTSHDCNHPLSLYAATKKANELMAHAYSHLFNFPSTGIRFFTVYGPWGRPDMALQKFAHAIMNGEQIKIFNHGNHKRDFTYIDDVIEMLIRVIDKPAQPNTAWSNSEPNPCSSQAPWKIYNIGNNQPVNLMDCIFALEKELGKIANKEFLPMQAGDVLETWANIDDLINDFGPPPHTTIQEGVSKFSKWFKEFYKYA